MYVQQFTPGEGGGTFIENQEPPMFATYFEHPYVQVVFLIKIFFS